MRFDGRRHRHSHNSPGSGADPLIAPRPRLWDRLVARWRSRTLDAVLADGVPAESSAAVALRARRLIDPCERRSIADGLRRLVREASEGPVRSRVRVAACWNRVAAASEELDELADALSRPGPVAVHGVAEALLLLTDGTGPLYNPESCVSLQTMATSAIADLQL
ncbi:MAG: hypothetical protein ACR2L9_12970 [Solirubrobacteraceae bacterium]|nr:hypothetical protein [Actinomycetota bacterium]